LEDLTLILSGSKQPINNQNKQIATNDKTNKQRSRNKRNETNKQAIKANKARNKAKLKQQEVHSAFQV